jgi:signal transduction histidine kinase
MGTWLWAVLGSLLLIIIALCIKIYLLQKAAKEIEEAFADRLITDTNTLIAISSRDKHVLHLANEINIQLRRLREERHRFVQGDMELKNAVTNISHDLRTPLTAICGYLELLEQEEKSEKAERYI